MLTGLDLKLIATASMIVDHMAWCFVDQGSWLGQLMHVLGRISAPIMCFLVAEGYARTHSLWGYIRRLITFAFLSQIPFTLFIYGKIALFPLNMLFTLTLGLLAICTHDKIQCRFFRFLALGAIMMTAMYGDWSFWAILFCLSFHVFRDDFRRQCISLSLLAVCLVALESLMDMQVGLGLITALQRNLFQLGIVGCLPLISEYGGSRGGTPYGRWFFYLFYPLHLLVLGILRWFK